MARRDSQPEDSGTALTSASASGAALGLLRRPVWRGFAAGILLLAPNSLWVYYMEGMTGHGPYISTISLFLNVVFIITLLGALATRSRAECGPRWR